MVKKQTMLCFVVHIKTDYVYKQISEDVKTMFDTSNSKLNRSLLKKMNKTFICVMKYKLIEKIFIGLSAKTQSYIIDDDSEDVKAKGTKNVS